jgi:ribosomal protein L11 methyltransferase
LAKSYPALQIRAANADLVLALLDDFGPTAVEEQADGLRAFFATSAARDAALGAVSPRFDASAIDVSDEDWARRSQENLAPVTVGRITISPSLPQSPIPNPQSQIPNPSSVFVLIVPSMGFGTGHHATTRLCLAALQELDLAGKTVLDVGTGSGVLAIAASGLGAASALGVDFDEDAIQSARENLVLNQSAGHASNVSFVVADLTATPMANADVLTANLTGALLVRTADRLLAATRSGGCLILSGVLASERDEVVRAFRVLSIAWERHEEEWVGLIMKKT